MWHACTLIVTYLLPLVMCDDFAHIGHYMYPAPDNRQYFAPGATSSADWNHELGGLFPTHGLVDNYMWRDPTTGAMSNCLRTIGGRYRSTSTPVPNDATNTFGTVPKLGTSVIPYQFVRFSDMYLCFQGLSQYAADVYQNIPFAVFINNKHATDTTSVITGNRRDDIPYVRYAPPIQSKTVSTASNLFTQAFPYVDMMWPRVTQITGLCLNENNAPAAGPSIFCPSQLKSFSEAISECGTYIIADSDSITRPITPSMDLSSARFTVQQNCVREGLGWVGLDPNAAGEIAQGSFIDNGNTGSPKGPDGFCGTDSDCFYLQSIYAHVPFMCALYSDRSSVFCVDPSQPDGFLLAKNRKTVASLLQTYGDFLRLSTSDHKDDPQLDTLATVLNFVPYQSWSSDGFDLEQLFTAWNFMADALLTKAGRTRVPNRTSRTAEIWSIPWTHVTPSITAGTTSTIYPVFETLDQKGGDLWVDYRNSLGRTSPQDAFFMLCPIPTHNNPGVVMTSRCNAQASNLNFCEGRVGRCFCDPNWAGIACDIPIPTGYTYEQMVSDPTDPFEICSTAGTLSATATFRVPLTLTTETTKTNVPVCQCISGFHGSPVNLNDSMAAYAKLFHSNLVRTFVANRNGNSQFFDVYAWYTHITGPDFDAAHNLQGVDDPQPTTQPRPLRGLKYNWYNQVLKHQCLMYTGPRSRPPQNLWWDYHSAPFIATMSGAITDRPYETGSFWFPWPAISTTRRNATFVGRNNTVADGRQGIRCMDYKEFDWDRLIDPSVGGNAAAYVAQYVKWLQTNPAFWPTTVQADGLPVVPKATLYGGPFCTPCPDCNRSNSVCVEGDPTTYTCDCNPATETCTITQTSQTICTAISPAKCRTCLPTCPSDCTVQILPPFGIRGCAKTTTTYHKTCTQPGPNVCKCDENFCGPTCDVPMCPVAASGKICGNGTCTINPATNCENLSPGQYGGVCKCDPGYTGIDCSTPTCPFFSSIDGSQCGNGTCNDEAGKCECNVGWTGNACDTPACPFDPNTNLECAGAVRADNGQSVCNRATQKCECFRTIALNLGSVVSGWIGTDLTPFVNGRYGVACEKVFGRACRDPQDGTWCGQPIQANGNFDGPLVAGYAGCYNETCVTKQLGGEECTPYCHCTLEFAVPQNTYCRKSVCGPEYCGFPKGKCNPHCSKNGIPQADTTCTTTAVLAGNLTLTPTCDCQVFNGTFYYHKHDDPDATAPCVDPAPLCYTPATVHSPCNGHGDCAYNVTSDSHFCMCDAGYSGANCSVAPNCFTPITQQACIGPTRSCSHDLGHNNAAVCACNSSYFRDPDRNCTLERCVSTGGFIDSDGECSCPNNTALYSDPPLSRTDLNHVALGCRKRCPVSPFDGIECGAYMYPSNTVSRCSDLYPTKNPIFGGDARPAPTCVCDFLGLDHKGQLNYFINASDFATSGMCEPKCNPDGLCKGDDCLPSGSPVGLAFPFECHCSPLYQGDRCEQIKCDQDHSHHTGGGQCQCHTWCRVGANCDVDLCAPSGGVCQAGLPDCDCSSTSNVLRVDSSNGRITNRNCTSACQNGGILSNDKQSCICVGNFFGTRCEKQRGCNPQWRGPSCNVSNCFNGGTPKPNVNDTGCVCADAFYAGVLCDQDLCIVANRRNRTGVSTCACAWSFTGDSCQVDPCSPGGSLSLLTGQCQCNQGWVLASNLTACLLPSTAGVDFYCDPDHGTVFNRSDGTQACICDSDYIGVNCSTPRCTAPLQGPYCMCPAGSYAPPSCNEDYCNSASIGYNATTQRCVCPVGYVLSNDVDASGTLQCVPDAHYCNYLGTVGWNNVSNHIPCICEEGWSGPTCSSFTSTTDDTASNDPVLSRNAMIAIAAATFLVVTLGIAGWIIYVKCIRDPLPTLLTQPSVNVTASKHWRSLNNDAKSAETNQWTRLRTNSDDDNNNDDDDNE